MKRFITVALALIMVFSLSFVAVAENETVTAIRSNQAVDLDGNPVSIGAYNIGGENYFKLRDLAAILNGTKAQFNVIYDAEKDAIFLVSGERYQQIPGDLERLPAGNRQGVATPQKIILPAGEGTAELNTGAIKGYNIDGNNFFRLRDLGKQLGFGVAYNEVKNSVIISSESTDVEDVKAETVVNQNNARVKIYGRDSCVYCVEAKEYLESKNVSYVYLDVRNNQTAKREYEEMGFSGVPIIVIGDEVIEGYSPSAIDEALAKL